MEPNKEIQPENSSSEEAVKPLIPPKVTRTFYIAFAIVFVIWMIITRFISFPVVNGHSMEQTLYEKDIMVMNKVAYQSAADIQRFDIVVVKSPENSLFLIKRVIGLPGETICIRGGRIYINGEPLEDPYLTEEITVIGVAEKEVLIDEDSIFVIGDNRNHSGDSRSFGPVAFNRVVGKCEKWLITKRNGETEFLKDL